MSTKNVFILFAFLLLTVAFNITDYLVVSRSATIKDNPSSDAAIIGRVKKGDYLELKSTKQENGYFKVKLPDSSLEGWIYRTFVRRYVGEIPGVSQEDSMSNFSTGTTGGEMVVRVLDVGAGLCIAIKLPDDKYIIYDAGHFRREGETTLNQLKKIIPEGSTIEQLIISHTDGDHIGAAGNIIKTYHVKKVVNTGYEKSLLSSSENQTAAYKRFLKSMSEKQYPMEYINLYERDSIISMGVTNIYDDAKIVFLCGFNKPLDEWRLSNMAEKINSVSIVAKLQYKGVSILLSGDAVGRHKDDNNPNALIATEKYLVENAGSMLKSDILIAPHHGGNNGSSTAFINAVNPSVVIFSAGNEYNHPTQNVANRYLLTVDVDNIFRTDRGDDERKPDKDCEEWSYGRIAGCTDLDGDDDVEIVIDNSGKYSVRYVFKNEECVE